MIPSFHHGARPHMLDHPYGDVQRWNFNDVAFNNGAFNLGVSQMGLQLQNLSQDPYFVVSKTVYDNQKTRILEEYKLRKEWIDKFSNEKALDNQLLEEWKAEALSMLNHSNISPAARKAVKVYLQEQKELHDALDRDEAKEEKEINAAEDELIKRHEAGHCWNKVDFLEQTWLHTYMTADDDEFGQTLFKQAKKHLDQQVRECKKIEAQKKEEKKAEIKATKATEQAKKKEEAAKEEAKK